MNGPKRGYIGVIVLGLAILLLMAAFTWIEAQIGGPPPDSFGMGGNLAKIVWFLAGALTIWGVVGAVIATRRER